MLRRTLEDPCDLNTALTATVKLACPEQRKIFRKFYLDEFIELVKKDSLMTKVDVVQDPDNIIHFKVIYNRIMPDSELKADILNDLITAIERAEYFDTTGEVVVWVGNYSPEAFKHIQQIFSEYFAWLKVNGSVHL